MSFLNPLKSQANALQSQRSQARGNLKDELAKLIVGEPDCFA